MLKNEWKLDNGKHILLITPEEYELLPLGTKLVCINGRELIKTISSGVTTDDNYIDNDTRFGYLAYGIYND